jgi:hypothetical protein
MPAGFADFFNPDAELWAPLRIPPAAFNARTNEFIHADRPLRAGSRTAEAQREMSAFAERLKAEHAGSYPVDWTLRARGRWPSRRRRRPHLAARCCWARWAWSC